MGTLSLLYTLTKTMRERGIEALEARVSIPHPYPEIAAPWRVFHFHLHQSGRMQIDGEEITDLREKLNYLDDATLHHTSRTLIHEDGQREEKAA